MAKTQIEVITSVGRREHPMLTQWIDSDQELLEPGNRFSCPKLNDKLLELDCRKKTPEQCGAISRNEGGPCDWLRVPSRAVGTRPAIDDMLSARAGLTVRAGRKSSW